MDDAPSSILTRNVISRSVEGFIRSRLNEAGATYQNVDARASLISGNILKSMDVLELILFLETEFGIDILNHDLDIANLDSIDAIASFLLSLAGEGPPPFDTQS